MPQVAEVIAKTILTPQKVGSLSGHYNYTLNPYAGCAFSCSYCYVPKFPNARHDYTEWGRWIEVKVNAPELIRAERNKVFGAKIFFSSATDPYQYLELKYRLARRCLEELIRYQPSKVNMHTRSHLMLEDLELLKSFGDRLSVGVSFTTDNENVRREFEPKAPSVARRLHLIQTLCAAGIDVYASLSPLLPCDPAKLVALVSPHVRSIWVDSMGSLEVNTRPELLQQYSNFFEESNYQQAQRKVLSLFEQERAKAPTLLRNKKRSHQSPHTVSSKNEDVRQLRLF